MLNPGVQYKARALNFIITCSVSHHVNDKKMCGGVNGQFNVSINVVLSTKQLLTAL